VLVSALNTCLPGKGKTDARFRRATCRRHFHSGGLASGMNAAYP
jgi:hypothetical protein